MRRAKKGKANIAKGPSNGGNEIGKKGTFLAHSFQDERGGGEDGKAGKGRLGGAGQGVRGHFIKGNCGCFRGGQLG